ncbi:fused response regulator/phosphatase [Skermania sp. ID1734]|uniref:PP2C family protein-serine/threonine phosphatase n=1 Tax=Skermania sp. ID1734 TaxID=2597516 RepID=UPI00117EEC25|nr:SpoIIE family protein phosphatase [Skermania sp. ID1734]TSE02225.1 fused response regulator/phosphatase [Skermania sp. ID1734]
MSTANVASESVSVLLVEDDPADALLVEELIADASTDIRLRWAASIAHANEELAAELPDCILLDLHLSDAQGIDALTQMQRLAESVPVVVLTGLSDEHFGASAVASGAQDYLVKGRVQPDGLRRAVHYAIERKRAERTAAELQASRLLAAENARLERGLLPSPILLPDAAVEIVARYRPGRSNALLGGDFYDVVQTADGVLHAVIGDVSGHGPDEAAVGVALRIAWRTLVLAGVAGQDLMPQLERILRAESPAKLVFATMTSLAISPDGMTATVTRAGHPGMLLQHRGQVDWLEAPGGPALGIRRDGGDWPTHTFDLPSGCGLILLTDGLFEGHCAANEARLGEAGLLRLAQSLASLPAEQFIDTLIDSAERLAGAHGGLADDVAVVRIQTRK